MKDTEKNFVLWVNYGYEGWSPTGFDTLKEALEYGKYSSEWVITKPVQYEIIDKSPS